MRIETPIPFSLARVICGAVLLGTAGAIAFDRAGGTDGTLAASRSWSFTDVTAESGLAFEHRHDGERIDAATVIVGGTAAGDYDGDGWIDLYVVRGDAGPNALFRNRGDGTFEDVAAAAGVALPGTLASGPTFADIDGDSWLDLIVLGVACKRKIAHCPDPGEQIAAPRLFRNRGDGTFEVTEASGIRVTRDSYSASFGDYNRDGLLDLFITHWGDNRPPGSSEHLWRNEGNFRFTDVSDAAGLTAAYTTPPTSEIGDLSFAANFADIDDDGWPDLLIAGDFRTSKVLLNNRDGTFREVTDHVISDENGMGAAVGDYDGNGHLDWFVSSIWDPNGFAEGNWYTSGNRLYRNRGDGTFEDVTDQAGVREGYWGWAATFADFNNDGHLDIFHVNGWTLHDPDAFEFHFDPSVLFVSNGDGTFTERAAELGLIDHTQGRGVVAFDYDRDGDLDIFIATNQDGFRLFRNDGGNTARFLTVRLRGEAPNTEGIGARVHVTASGRTQMRELRAGTNFVSQDPAEAHFGLGTAASVDAVRVIWPDGSVTELGPLATNQILTIHQDGTQPISTPIATPSPAPTPSPTVPPPPSPTPSATPPPSRTPAPECFGDCGGDGIVTVAELITLVRIALGESADCPGAGATPVSVEHLVQAVHNALLGC